MIVMQISYISFQVPSKDIGLVLFISCFVLEAENAVHSLAFSI